MKKESLDHALAEQEVSERKFLMHLEKELVPSEADTLSMDFEEIVLRKWQQAKRKSLRIFWIRLVLGTLLFSFLSCCSNANIKLKAMRLCIGVDPGIAIISPRTK